MGVNLFGGDLEVTIDPRAVVVFEQVVGSLDGVERSLLDVAAADKTTADSMGKLALAFQKGEVTALQLRNGLRSLLGVIPQTSAELRKAAEEAEKYSLRQVQALAAANSRAFALASSDAAARLARDQQTFRQAMQRYEYDTSRVGRALTNLERNSAFPNLARHANDAARRISSSLDDIGHAARRAGTALRESLTLQNAGGALRNADLGGFASAVRGGLGAAAPYAAGALYGGMHAAEHVTERLAEFERLQRVQREFGVNFSEAQAGSRRFVSQENVAGLAEHFASAHVNLNQTQLNSMTQGAARLAQMQGTSVEMQSDRLFSAIVGGELEVLRRLGPEMAALSGQSHTAQERLEAFMRTVQALGPATEDSATAMERFKESLKMSERTFFAAVKDEIQDLIAENGPFTNLRNMFSGLSGDAEAWGRRTAHAIMLVAAGANVVVGAWSTMGNVLGLVGQQGRAVWEVLRGRGESARFVSSEDFLNAVGPMQQGLLQLRRTMGSVYASPVSAGSTPGGLADAGGGTAPDDVRDPLAGADHGWGGAPVGEGAIGGAVMPEATPGHRGGAFLRHRRQHHGRGARGHRPTIDQLMQRAFHERGASVRSSMNLGFRGSFQGTEEERQSAADLDARDDKQRVLRRAMETEDREAATAEEDKQKALLQGQERQQGLMESLTEAARRYDETMYHLRGTVVGAFEDMTGALGAHIGAWAEGRETFGDAMQGMLGDFLKATSKRALMSGTEEAAASLASLAIGDLRGAGLHAAASAGYFTLAGLAGAAGAAVAPAAAGGGAGGAAARDRAPSISPRSSSSREAGPNITINFGAPVVAGNPAQAGRLIAGMVRDAMVREGTTLPGLGLS